MARANRRARSAKTDADDTRVAPIELTTLTALAQALSGSKKYDEALAVYQSLLPKARKDRDNPQRVLDCAVQLLRTRQPANR